MAPIMNKDDLPPPRRHSESDSSLGGQLGLIFTGLAWVAIFAAIGGGVLWMVIHWL
ncbi:MAG: hypothetical protein WDN03_08875 [Rhizomicrobium sp.]